MAFDGMVTTSVVRELQQKLTGTRIEKIYQPAADEIILYIRSGRDKHLLYISANTSHAGLYLTDDKGLNPQNPPAFCMLLRKHLQSARIREIRQIDSERIVEIHTDAVNELGFDVNHKLVIEIMGKHSNILLIDMKTSRIIDCIKRISGDVNRYRQTLPGLAYVAPPSHDKLSYFNLSRAAFTDVLGDITAKPDKALMSAIQGLSPVAAEEICHRAASGGGLLTADRLYDELMKAVGEIGAERPCIYRDQDGTPKDFHVIRLTMYDGTFATESYDTVSEACSAYFEGRASSNRVRQKSSDIRHHVSAVLDKMLLKKQRLSEDLLRAEDSEKYRLYGELLTASLYSVQDGRSSAEVVNYYDGSKMTIPLDPRFTAAQNAQRYFRKYGKSKTAIIEKKKQLQETDIEIQYLESVLTFIDNAGTAEDIEDIRQELIENGIIRRRNQRERPRKTRIMPIEYHTKSGKRILVGRNNRENDVLTFREASSHDIWLHTKDIPGSHVILFLNGEEPSEEEIFEAASIAAAHSKARLSGQVPVDYVPVKYVKKPNGSKPGYVIFTRNRTVYVEPAAI